MTDDILDISSADILDEACRLALEAQAAGRPATHLRVHPLVYHRFAHARAAELERGEPLELLGLRVVAAPLAKPADVQVV